jgi:hypothetical protein
MAADASVFVRGVGFRPPRDGVGLAKPVTVTKDADNALRVMFLVSSAERGTELAFEMDDPPREAAARAGFADYEWHRRMQVQLRDISGAPVARSSKVRGDSFSMGQHEFGFLRQEMVFDRLSPDARRVTLEIRGNLGEWDIPLSLVPLAETGIAATMPDAAEETRDGITVRVRGVVATDVETVLDVEAVAAPPARSILAISAWPTRYQARDLLALIDGQGRRLDEITPAQRPHNWRQGDRTVATFPPLPFDSTDFTLLVPAVQIAESEGSVDVTLPTYRPTDMKFGRCLMTIRWADVIEDMRPAPGQETTRGVEVHFRPASADDPRRVLRPGRVLVDGAATSSFGFDYADSQGPVMKVRLPASGMAKTLTLLDPVVEVRGPWEVRWRR